MFYPSRQFYFRSFFFGGESGLSVSSFELFILGSVITEELSERTIAVFSLLVGGQGSDC